MKEYFLGLIVFAFFGSVIISLAPSGSPKRYLRLLCGLCSVGCIALPIFDTVSGEGVSREDIIAIFEADAESESACAEIYNSAINSASIVNAELALRERIVSELNADYDAVEVKISLADSVGGVGVEKVWIYIYPSGLALNPDKIRILVAESFDAPCEFLYRRE